MSEDEAKNLLVTALNITEKDIEKLEIFSSLLLDFNIKYNLISKSTEKLIWSRHILDSAQLVKHYDSKSGSKLVDFGTGAGFPGLVLTIINKNPKFHVKLYEKSPVKRDFLNIIKKKFNLDVAIANNVYDEPIDADIIVSRAFKKIDQIIQISREIIKKPHKIIILKGKNAEIEINNVSLGQNYSYKLRKSITDNDSKIIILDVR